MICPGSRNRRYDCRRKSDEQRKIIIITKNMVGDGAERVIAQLSNYFVAQGKSCKIITLNDDEVFYALASRFRFCLLDLRVRTRCWTS